jgi:hypothetical protein
VAVENKRNKAGFIAKEAVDSVSAKPTKGLLAPHFKHGRHVRTDAFPPMNIIDETHRHKKKVTPPSSKAFLI